MPWFNRLSPDGLHWVGEQDGNIVQDGRVIAKGGIQPCWFVGMPIWSATDAAALRSASGVDTRLPAPCNWLEANEKNWLAWMPTYPGYSLSGTAVKSFVRPSLRADGTLYFPPSGAIEPREGLAIQHGQGAPFVVPVEWAPWKPTTHLAVPVPTPGGMWVLRVEDARLVLHPAGSHQGYVVATGDTHHPDAKWCPAKEAVAIVYTDARGATVYLPQSLLPGLLVDLTPGQIDVMPEQVPNYLHWVELLASAYPKEFHEAHRPELGERAYTFIRRLAYVLYQKDNRVGLNGKRGGDVLSWDALSVKLPDRLAVVDVIQGAGGDNPQPSWNEVGGESKWFQPSPVQEEQPPVTPPPVNQPEPHPQNDLLRILNKLDELHANNVHLQQKLDDLVAELYEVRATQHEFQQRTEGLLVRLLAPRSVRIAGISGSIGAAPEK